MVRLDIVQLKADLDDARTAYLEGVKEEAKALRLVLYKFCLSKPPLELCVAWLQGEPNPQTHELQSWVASNIRPSFDAFMAIGIIEAARTLIDNEVPESETGESE